MTLPATCSRPSILRTALRRFTCITACVLGLSLAPRVSASVITTSGISWSSPLSINNGVFIDVRTGARGEDAAVPTWDLQLFLFGGTEFDISTRSVTLPGVTFASGGVVVENPDFIASFLGSLPLGTTIGPSAEFNESPLEGLPFESGSGSVPGVWSFNETNYFGFRFQNELTNDLHYGYGRVNIGSTAAQATLTGLFFEDQAGVPIVVGVIPEPASALLGAVGVMGLFASRRLRRTA